MKLAANHTQGRLARGGHLSATPEGIAFEPHALERRLRARSVFIPAREVVRIDLEPGGLDGLANLFDGGLRDRLRIETLTLGVHHFVVGEPLYTRDELRRLMPGADQLDSMTGNDSKRSARNQTVWPFAFTALSMALTFISQLIAVNENGLTTTRVTLLLLSSLLAAVCIILIVRVGRRRRRK